MRTKLYPNTPEFDSIFEALLKSAGKIQYNGITIPMGGWMHRGQCSPERNELLHHPGFKKFIGVNFLRDRSTTRDIHY